MNRSQESIQLINTAIIKSKEKRIDSSYEERLNQICSTPAVEILSQAIKTLADQENISRDHAAIQIVEAVRDLDSIWGDYVTMEGIQKLKNILRDTSH